MAAPKASGNEKRRKKKSKSRTQVELSSSDNESDAPQQGGTKSPRASKQQDVDIPMGDTPDALSSSSPALAPTAAPAIAKSAPQEEVEEFSAIYLRKVTVELADDLDKVRDAQDFKASSLPMLVHALRQGASIYSTEEKRRVIKAIG